MAIGFMRRCAELGKRVPQDIAILGFDDIVLSGYTNPQLSTVRQDMRATGEAALRLLIEMIEHHQPGRRLIMPHKLVCRESA
jgi:DNA-binding LacI/PurR family transcriptional regulator